MNEYIRLLLAIATCYRLARMIATDDGPFFIFKRIRYWIKDKAWNNAHLDGYVVWGDAEQKNIIDDRYFGKWHNLAEGITCPYCTGVWLSLLLLLFIIYPTLASDLFLILMTISGGQAFLQSLDKK